MRMNTHQQNLSLSVAMWFVVHCVVCCIKREFLYKCNALCQHLALPTHGHNPHQYGGIIEPFYGNKLSRHKTGRIPHSSPRHSAASILFWFKCKCQPMPPDFKEGRSGHRVLQSHRHRGNQHRTCAHCSSLLTTCNFMKCYLFDLIKHRMD